MNALISKAFAGGDDDADITGFADRPLSAFIGTIDSSFKPRGKRVPTLNAATQAYPATVHVFDCSRQPTDTDPDYVLHPGMPFFLGLTTERKKPYGACCKWEGHDHIYATVCNDVSVVDNTEPTSLYEIEGFEWDGNTLTRSRDLGQLTVGQFDKLVVWTEPDEFQIKMIRDEVNESGFVKLTLDGDALEGGKKYRFFVHNSDVLAGRSTAEVVELLRDLPTTTECGPLARLAGVTGMFQSVVQYKFELNEVIAAVVLQGLTVVNVQPSFYEEFAAVAGGDHLFLVAPKEGIEQQETDDGTTTKFHFKICPGSATHADDFWWAYLGIFVGEYTSHIGVLPELPSAYVAVNPFFYISDTTEPAFCHHSNATTQWRSAARNDDGNYLILF